MDKVSQELHEYYASRARYYDEVYQKPERAADIAFFARYLPEVFRNRRVLEIACGTGYWTQHIGATVDSMLSTDGTAEPLEFAKLRPNTERVRFEQVDAYHLPQSLGVFNAGFAGLWFSHVPIEKRELFLRGFHARLEPNSHVVMIDNNMVQCNDFPIVETDRHGNTYQHRKLKDGVTHRVLKNFPNESEWKKLLGGSVGRFDFRMLDNFWLVEYDLCV